MLILDGTAAERLCRLVFGDELEVLDYKVERQAYAAVAQRA